MVEQAARPVASVFVGGGASKAGMGRAVYEYGGAAALRDGSSSLALPKSGVSGEAMVQIHHGGRWSIVGLIDAEKG